MKNKILRSLTLSSVVMMASLYSASTSWAATKKSTPSQYAVNMQDGGLILKEENDSSMNVARTYRSRSLNHGFFGSGWCTDFESEIIFQGRGVIRLVNCQSARPSLFKVSETASAYVNQDNPHDRILIRLGYYERVLQNVGIAKYNFKGKLIEYKKAKKTIKVSYNDRALPEKLLLDTNQKTENVIQFSWHPLLDLIQKVQTNGKLQSYEYSGFQLVKMTTGTAVTSYTYDDLDNLTAKRVSTLTFDLKKKLKSEIVEENLIIAYDKIADTVLKIEGSCQENYTYKKISAKRTLSTVSKSCQNQGSKKEFIFEYAEDNLRPLHIVVLELPLSPVERLALNQTRNSEGEL